MNADDRLDIFFATVAMATRAQVDRISLKLADAIKIRDELSRLAGAERLCEEALKRSA